MMASQTAMKIQSRALAIALNIVFISEAFSATWIVNCQHQSASDSNPGTETAPLRTISQAAQLAQPGDTVLVHAGIYREHVAPARGGTPDRPIQYRVANGEDVVIKGSEVWQPVWKQVGASPQILAGRLDPSWFVDGTANPYRTLLKGMPKDSRLTLGQVFVDGNPLREVDRSQELIATPATWMVASTGDELIVHFPKEVTSPEEGLVEITTRQRIFAPHRRGLGHIHVTGFTMEHCANQFPDQFWQSETPQAGALGCRAGHHWVIDNNTVRFAKSIGIDCGYEGRHDLDGNQPTPQNTGFHLINNNHVSDNGCCGIAGMRSIGTQIVDNVIENNNSNHHAAPEIAGIKVHYFVDGLIARNLLRNNDGHGIWLDNTYRNARVRQNLVIGNRGSAIFVELGEGPVLIDNNVLANTRPGLDGNESRADGLYTHDASGVTFAHNLVFGCDRFGSSHRKMTNRNKAGVARIALLNNIFINNQAGHLDWPYPGQFATSNIAECNIFGTQGEFVVNAWGGNAQDVVISALSRQMGRTPRLWNGVSPRLTLAELQANVRGVSHNQLLHEASANLSESLVLELKLGVDGRAQTMSRVEGVLEDYFGRPYTTEALFVGPFQSLSAGTLSSSLWTTRVTGAQ